MRAPNSATLTIVFFFLIVYQQAVTAQLSYQLNAELGFYNSRSNIFQKESNILTRFDSKLAYTFEKERTTASLQLKLRPEFYGFKNQLTSLKFRAVGEYSCREESFDWNINLSRQLNRVTNDKTIIDYDILFLQGNINLFTIQDFPITLRGGYAYQNVYSSSEQNLDLIFGEAKINQIFNSYFRTGYGLYAEKFSVKNKERIGFQNIDRSNSGYRVGPEIELYHLKDFIINCQYRFLFHISDVTGFPSYEQWIKLVAGKILFTDFSAFVLINFYLRKYNNNTNDNSSILYTPINQENYISFKTAYDITEKMTIYFKAGYFSENLIYNNYSFEGWSFVLGIEFGN